MTGMEAFDKFSGVGNLEKQAGDLAKHAAEALNNNEMTERGYRPVTTNWKGMGQDTAAKAPAPLNDTAHHSHTALSWAGVVTAGWCGQMAKFNKRVDQIVHSYDTAKNGVRYPGATQPTLGLKDAGKQTDPTKELARLRAKAVAEYNTAYESMILDQRWRFRSMLQQGPTVDNIERARKWGVLPQPDDYSENPFQAMWHGFTGLWDSGKYLLHFFVSDWIGKGGNLTDLWKAFNKDPTLTESLGRWADGLGKLSTATGLVFTFDEQWQADSGRRMGLGEHIARSGTHALVSSAAGFAGSTVGGGLGGLAGGLIGPEGAVVGTVVGGTVGGAAGSGLGEPIAHYLMDPIGRGERNLSELIRRSPGLLNGPTT